MRVILEGEREGGGSEGCGSLRVVMDVYGSLCCKVCVSKGDGNGSGDTAFDCNEFLLIVV